VYKINPQLHNFRIKYGASAAIFQTEDPLGVLPPESWDIDEIGRTILPSCGPFVFLKTKFGCHLCDMNAYRKGDALTFPNPEDAYKRGGKCTSCPANTAAGLQSTKIEDCVSARGYNKVGNQACRICPANTYKSTISRSNINQSQIRVCLVVRATGLVAARQTSASVYCRFRLANTRQLYPCTRQCWV